MDEPVTETKEKKSRTTIILYGLLAIIVVLVVVVLVAKYVFNINLLDFNEVSDMIMLRARRAR